MDMQTEESTPTAEAVRRRDMYEQNLIEAVEEIVRSTPREIDLFLGQAARKFRKPGGGRLLRRDGTLRTAVKVQIGRAIHDAVGALAPLLERGAAGLPEAVKHLSGRETVGDLWEHFLARLSRKVIGSFAGATSSSVAEAIKKIIEQATTRDEFPNAPQAADIAELLGRQGTAEGTADATAISILVMIESYPDGHLAVIPRTERLEILLAALDKLLPVPLDEVQRIRKEIVSALDAARAESGEDKVN